MKTLLIIVLMASCVIQLRAQKMKENEVPKAVKDAFVKAYPKATDVKWEKEEGLFEVSFDFKKNDMSVLLDEMGIIKEEETEIKKSELPQAVQDVLKKDYAGYKIEEAAKILANGVTTYEAEVEKGEKTFELLFDSTGKLLKKTEEEDDEKV